MSRRHLTSTISSKSQTVLPREVRERLKLGQGDRLRYVIEGEVIRIEKDRAEAGDDPFLTFSEWSGAEDEAAFADL